jgi:malonyl-CoA/methylmalonyl-CoA synthetase
MTGNLFAKIRAAAPSLDRTFIETHDGRVVTYGDLFDASGRYANVLRAAGVTFGDRVVVQVEKSPECVLLYLACLRLGAAYLPLNQAYTLAELDYFIGDSEPRVVVCAPERVREIAALAEGLGVATTLTLGTDGKTGSLVEAATDQSPEFTDAVCAEDDLAAILYTSGTTGRSKGAMLTHRNLASNALTLMELWRFTGDDVLLNALPIFHTHGLFVASNVTLMAGGTMIFLPKLDPDLVFRFLPRSTTMMGVPTFYVRLLQDARLTREATAHIRLFVSGSAPLLAETHSEWQARTGHAVLERYGMTETGMNTSNPYEGPRVAGSVGPPLPDVEIRIAHPETGASIPEGEIGMIEVRGPNVFKGYWRMPEKTAAEFRPDGFFITGDLGVIDNAGYVSIVGRGKDLVISGGYNVYPKEVETEIDGLHGIDETAVIGVPHPDFGEGVTAVCTLKPGTELDEAAVLKQLADRLAKYKQPKRVIFVDALPRNTMGKVQKTVLREQHKDLYRG